VLAELDRNTVGDVIDVLKRNCEQLRSKNERIQRQAQNEREQLQDEREQF